MTIKLTNDDFKKIEVKDDTVALIKGDAVQLNQLDPLGNKDPFKYTSIYLKKDDIINLAEQLKKL